MSLDETAKDFLGTGRVEAFAGKTRDLDATQKRLAEVADEASLTEAARFTEEIIAWLNTRSLELNLDPEQRIFAVSLATINLRQNFPPSKGGKDFFDKVSRRAWEYFDAATK